MDNSLNINILLEEKLQEYTPITLEEMDTVKLMNRTDTKFFFHVNLLSEILERAKEYYRVLEISNRRQFQYHTTYFDTPDLLLYNEHLNGKLNRYKVRQRRYDVTGKEFFEVKYKTNKGRTLKSRIENNNCQCLNEQTNTFLQKKTPYNNNILEQALKNDFFRITLVNNRLSERATLDYDINFSDFSNEYHCPLLGIAEIKQDNQSGSSMLLQIIKELGIRPQGISKYCLGVASLYPNVKINRLKPQINKINNL
jgi:hypothetical protein